jgi:hypothetical protein
MLGNSFNDKVMFRQGHLVCGERRIWVGKALLDTGAQRGNYIGRALLDRMLERSMDISCEPCSHWVRLGDGKTQVHITEYVTADVALFDDDDELVE